MHKSIIIILFVAIGLPAAAQNWHEADSLRKALGRTSTDTSRADILLKLAKFEIFKPGEFKKDLDSAAAYIAQAKKINRKINSIEISGYTVLVESHLVTERGQKAQGKALNEKAVEILNKGTNKYYLGQAYLDLAEYYSYYDQSELAKRLAIVSDAAKIFKNGGYVEREAYARKSLGELGTNDAECLKQLNVSLQLYQSVHYREIQAVYDAIAAVYLDMSDFRRALNNDLTALKIAQNTRDTSMQLCEINNHIGIIYFNLQDYARATKYFENALRTADVYKDVQTIYLLTANICQANLQINRPKEVLNILRHTLSKYPTTQNAAEIDCIFTCSYLRAYISLKQYNLAKPYCDRLVNAIAKNRITKRTLSDMYKTLINYFFATKQYGREHIYLMKNDTLTRQLGIAIYISSNNSLWFQLDTAQHNYKAAVSHILLRDKINDSTFTATKNKQIRQLEVQYETQQKENQINLLNQKAALQQSNLHQANLVKNVTMGGIVLALIIASLLYRQSRLQRRNNKVISHQNDLITQKNGQLQGLVAEKEWLLKEVHHRVKNNLHSVICLLEAQAAYLENDALQAIENSQHRIYTMSLIHQKLYMAEDIKTIDMATYIPELIHYLRDSFDISNRIHFQMKIDPILLNPSQAIPLALIINEALTNSIKYGFPDERMGEIWISLTSCGTKYKLELADNGIGIPEKAATEAKSSFGLQLIKGLAEDIGAEIKFENDNGVKIQLIFDRDQLHEMDVRLQ